IPDVSLMLLHLQGVAEEVRVKPEPVEKPRTNIWRVIFKSSPELAERGVTVNTIREQLRKYGEILRASAQVLDGGKIAFEFMISAVAPESGFTDLNSLGIEYERVSEDFAQTEAAPEPEPARAVAHDFIRVEMSRLD